MNKKLFNKKKLYLKLTNLRRYKLGKVKKPSRNMFKWEKVN